MKILFTGGRAPATLEMVRIFGRYGWEVHVADNLTPILAQYSRYTKAFHYIHSPRNEEALFVSDLVRIVNRYNIDILFPTCEEIFWIAKNKDELEQKCKVQILCDSIDKLALLHNKLLFIEFAKALGITVPETRRYVSTDAVMRKSVIKPIFSRFGEDIIIVDGTTVAMPQRDNYIMQQFIKGESICSYGYAADGLLLFNTCYRSPLQSTSAFTVFEPCECAAIDSITSKIVAELSFTGSIAFDFIYSNGLYYVIECNPRVTSGLHTLHNLDFRKVLQGESVAFSRRSAQLLMPTLMTSGRVMHYGDVIFSKSDIMPALMQLPCMMRFLSLARKHRVSLNKAIVMDIEWNGDGLP